MPTWGLVSHDSQVLLTLTDVSFNSSIVDCNASVTIEQTYKNNTEALVESVYKFPLDVKAAVCKFEVDVDGKHIIGVVKEKREAKKEYDDAIARGDGAFLLEKDAPERFIATVGALKPGSTAVVQITYITALSMEGENLEFQLPFMVLPKYTPSENVKIEPPSEQTTAAVSSTVQTGNYRVNINITATNDNGIKEIVSKTHKLETERVDDEVMNVRIKEFTETKDFIMHIVMEEPHDPMCHAERDKDSASVAVGLSFIPHFKREAGTGSEVVFVVDRSGSMSGYRMVAAKETLKFCLRSLDENCLFNIFGFGSRFEMLATESMPYDEEKFKQANNNVDAMFANMGGTRLLEPLKAVFEAEPVHDTRQVFVLTDGAVANTNEVIALCRKHRQTNRIFAFGIGTGASQALVTGMAEATNGQAEFIRDNDEIVSKVMRQMRRALDSSISGVSLELFTRDDEPIMSSRSQDLFLSPSSPTTIYHNDRYMSYAVVEPLAGGTVPEPGYVLLSGIKSGSGDNIEFKVAVPPPNETSFKEGTSMMHTCAGHALIKNREESWSETGLAADRKDALKQTIVALSVKYNLASQFSSFLAIEDREGEQAELDTTMTQVKVPMDNTRGQPGGGGGMFANSYRGFQAGARAGGRPAPAGPPMALSMAADVPMKSMKKKGGFSFGGLFGARKTNSSRRKHAEAVPAAAVAGGRVGFAPAAAPAPEPEPVRFCDTREEILDYSFSQDDSSGEEEADAGMAAPMAKMEFEKEKSEPPLPRGVPGRRRAKESAKTRAPPPAAAAQDYKGLIMQQEFSGLWPASQSVLSMLGVNRKSLASALEKEFAGQGVSDLHVRLAVNLLVIRWLGVNAAGSEDEWRMLADKCFAKVSSSVEAETLQKLQAVANAYSL